GQPLVERLLHRGSGGERTVAGDGAELHVARIRHVEQVVVAAAVAVGITVEDVAVRTAAAALVHQAHAGLVVAEERVLPVQRAGDAVLDLVAAVLGDFLADVEAVLVRVARAGGGAGQRAEFGGVGVGVNTGSRLSSV